MTILLMVPISLPSGEEVLQGGEAKMTYLALCPIKLSSGVTENALPCPFCAAAADLELRPDGQLGSKVVCRTCGAVGPLADDGGMADNETAAVRSWNTRYFYQDSDDAPATLPDDNPC